MNYVLTVLKFGNISTQILSGSIVVTKEMDVYKNMH